MHLSDDLLCFALKECMANSDLVKSCTWAALKMHILRRQTCEFGPENCWKMCISPWTLDVCWDPCPPAASGLKAIRQVS